MTISVGNLIVAGGATVDTSEVLSALNKQGLKVWVGTKTQRDALPENIKNDDKITFLTYDSEEDIYLIIDTIISYSKTWSSVKISTELAKKINSSDVYTKTEVMQIINSKVASALKYRGAVATVAALPSSGQENGDSYYVQADGYMYAWSSDYSDWQALGSATDMTNYYTKSEVDALLADMAVKFQYTTMPTADSTTVGKIIQYTGADTQDYKNGYWYKGVDNGDSTYDWAQDTAYIPTKMTIDNCQKVIGKTSFSSNEIVDVNNLQESGIYSVWTSTNASNLPRYDYATWWEISVITKSNLHSHYCHQIAIGANDLVYVRQCDNSVWSSWKQLATKDDIFRVGDRRDVIGWADLTSDVNVDGSSNYANNVGRIDGRNAMILVSNPTSTYQWPVTNSGNRNIFLDFGSYVQFFVDTVNNSLYVRSRDSVDMGNWGEITTKSNLTPLVPYTQTDGNYLMVYAAQHWNTYSNKALCKAYTSSGELVFAGILQWNGNTGSSINDRIATKQAGSGSITATNNMGTVSFSENVTYIEMHRIGSHD